MNIHLSDETRTKLERITNHEDISMSRLISDLIELEYDALEHELTPDIEGIYTND